MWTKGEETGHQQPEMDSTQKNVCMSGATQQSGDLQEA